MVAATAAAKLVALLIGLAAYLILRSADIEHGDSGLWVIMLWYLTHGGIIGVMNIYETEKMLPVRLPWWIRAPFVSAWMNLVVALLAADSINRFIVTAKFLYVSYSHLWFVADGFVVGIVTGYISYRIERRIALRLVS